MHLESRDSGTVHRSGQASTQSAPVGTKPVGVSATIVSTCNLPVLLLLVYTVALANSNTCRACTVPSQDCQTADDNDADGVMGFGLTGQDCCPMGAGYTNFFVDDVANNGHESRQQAWIMVRHAAPKVPAGWTVVLKTNGDDTFQYNSPYWTDTATVLNEDQDLLVVGNAKYSAYNTQEFDAVMACVGSLTNCIPGYRFDEPIANAAALFGGQHRREGVVYENFLHVRLFFDCRVTLV